LYPATIKRHVTPSEAKDPGAPSGVLVVCGSSVVERTVLGRLAGLLRGLLRHLLRAVRLGLRR
jgi:hypothetical protein